MLTCCGRVNLSTKLVRARSSLCCFESARQPVDVAVRRSFTPTARPARTLLGRVERVQNALSHSKWRCKHWKARIASRLCIHDKGLSFFVLTDDNRVPSPPSSKTSFLVRDIASLSHFVKDTVPVVDASDELTNNCSIVGPVLHELLMFA
jgi:hypothetical protein